MGKSVKKKNSKIEVRIDYLYPLYTFKGILYSNHFFLFISSYSPI